MNESDRRLVIAIGTAARTAAMYRELVEVARRYGNEHEQDRLTASLAAAERALAALIDEALGDAGPGGGPDDDEGQSA